MDFSRFEALPYNQKTASGSKQFERKVKIAVAIRFCSRLVYNSFAIVYKISLLTLLFSHERPPLFTFATPCFHKWSFERHVHLAQFSRWIFYVLASCTKMRAVWYFLPFKVFSLPFLSFYYHIFGTGIAIRQKVCYTVPDGFLPRHSTERNTPP